VVNDASVFPRKPSDLRVFYRGIQDQVKGKKKRKKKRGRRCGVRKPLSVCGGVALAAAANRGEGMNGGEGGRLE